MGTFEALQVTDSIVTVHFLSNGAGVGLLTYGLARPRAHRFDPNHFVSLTCGPRSLLVIFFSTPARVRACLYAMAGGEVPCHLLEPLLIGYVLRALNAHQSLFPKVVLYLLPSLTLPMAGA